MFNSVFNAQVFYTLLVGLVVGFVVQNYALFIRRWLEQIDAKRLEKRLDKDKYTTVGFKKSAISAVNIYVFPDCQDNDPSSEQGDTKRRPLFRAIDDLLGPPLRGKCFLLLADSGMGKSEFLQQYYRYHWISPKKSDRFYLIVIPLNNPEADELIKRVPLSDRDDTVLFLDALDEDNAAVDSLRDRFAMLMRLTQGFRAILITCRTQFLADDKAIPRELEVSAVTGPLGLGSGLDRQIRRLYLSRLSRPQIRLYIRKRYPVIRHPVLRFRAGSTAQKFGDLIARPLILTFIEDLVNQKKPPKFSYQVYEIIVDEWLKREEQKKHLASTRDALLRFSELFAGALFSKGVPGLPGDELVKLADHCGITLDVAEVRERSLLSYADGIWKFAHRSIMEYLLVRDVQKAEEAPDWVKADRPWTDVMERIAWEMILDAKKMPYARLKRVKLDGYNLRGVNFEGVHFDDADARGVDFSEALRLTARHAASLDSNKRTKWPVRVLKGNDADVTCCAMDSNENLVISGSSDGTLTIWDLKTERLLVKNHITQGGITCCATGIRGDFYAIGADNIIHIIESSGKSKARLQGHDDLVSSCVVVFGEDSIISASHDATVKLWDVSSGKVKREMRGLTGGLTCCAVATGRRLVAAGSSDSSLCVWNFDTGELIHKLVGHTEAIKCCALDATGTVAISGSRDKTLRVWNLTTGETIHILRGHEGTVYSCSMFHRANLIVSGAIDETLIIWNWKTGNGCARLHGHSQRISCCVIGSKDDFLISGSHDKTVRVWFPQWDTTRLT